jgi:hypothetical protein
VSGSNPNFPVCKRATYQGCEVIVSERMKVIPIQWVRDLGIGPVGKCHRRHRMPDTTRNVPFAVRRIDCPIPVRKSHSVSDFQGFVSWCTFRVLVSDIQDTADATSRTNCSYAGSSPSYVDRPGPDQSHRPISRTERHGYLGLVRDVGSCIEIASYQQLGSMRASRSGP